MFTPVSCVFAEAGGQFYMEDDPDEGRQTHEPVVTSWCFSGALQPERVCVCLPNFPRVEFVYLRSAQ